MINSDVLTDWRPFFLMVAGASASLTGLLFVALSLHAREIASQPLYRYRARLSLASLMAILVIASLVLIPRQNALELGVKEIFPIATILIVLALGLLELRHMPDGARRPYAIRTAIAVALVVLAAVGNVLLATGRSVGLEILALCCVVFLVWLVFNAWALVIGLADERSRQQSR
jgi:hypothetical protein